MRRAVCVPLHVQVDDTTLKATPASAAAVKLPAIAVRPHGVCPRAAQLTLVSPMSDQSRTRRCDERVQFCRAAHCGSPPTL